MKKLLKHMSPLAPDDSGACSVLYELGGIVVICDAGGCAGNVCGFDEPRWHEKRSALFSAGLRDMDAILGRDDKLVEKLVKVSEQIESNFTAIIGTPVPAVIATDYKALKKLSEKKTGKPCITIQADGTKLYDKGEEEAYLKIFEEFAADKSEAVKGKTGVIGATPLDTGYTHANDILRGLDGEYVCFGMDSGIEEIRRASECEKLIVIAPSGIKAAEYLNKKFGTPYEVSFPCVPPDVKEKLKSAKAEKALIIHQQFAANEVRKLLENTVSEIHCASWFMLDSRYADEKDFHIDSEEVLTEKVNAEGYDLIIADAIFKRVLRSFQGEWIDFPHYAVSGRFISAAT